MISANDLNNEIKDLENQNPTFGGMQKLASLYIVRDHMTNTPTLEITPQTQEISKVGDSDFMKEIQGRDPDKIWSIIDETMSTVYVIEPKLYEAVMRKIREI